MDEQGIRKTYKYKLKPTPEQERAMAFVLRRCRELYNAALQERKDAWQKCGVSVSVAQQSAQLPAIKVVRPEYGDIHRDRRRKPRAVRPGRNAPLPRGGADLHQHATLAYCSNL
jgi:hypothetical protein